MELLNSIEGLPFVEIDGRKLFIRTLGSQEFLDIIDDCRRYARALTPEDLKGQAPNPMKLMILQKMLAASKEDASMLVGEVNEKDAYSVGFGHAVVTHLVAFQAARSLVLEDSSDAFPAYEQRAIFVTATVRRPQLLALLNEAIASIQADPIPNDSPADSQE